MHSTDVVLVSMPWPELSLPSIQLGTLNALLQREAIASDTFHAYVTFADWACTNLKSVFDLRTYQAVSHRAVGGLGEMIFNIEPYRTLTAEQESDYWSFCKASGEQEETIAAAIALRHAVPSFLEICLDRILSKNPKIVGFTTSFAQNIPSLVLAKLLKQRNPSLHIMFGGANCEGEMGATLHRLHDCIDVVVRGAAESVIGPLCHTLLSGGDPSGLPGVCVRYGTHLFVNDEQPPSVPMDEVPTPVYDEYFDALAQASFGELLKDALQLTYETSRGCWWGAKHHCTFCGLNGNSMAFRSKSSQRVAEELIDLAKRYRILDFNVVDNILDMQYLKTLFPVLQELGAQFSFYFETKANLTRSQVALLKQAGVDRIQPGIESLSTALLRLMNKGTSAIQNVQLLKWCAEYGLGVDWNILCDLPGEDHSEYATMAEFVPHLFHLPPPNGVSPVRIDRFSPYFASPESYGIEIRGPMTFYKYLYAADDAALAGLAYFFDRVPSRVVAEHRTLSARVREWRAAYAREDRPTLTARRGPGFIVISDRRTPQVERRYVLEDIEAAIYMGIDAANTAHGVHRRLSTNIRDSYSSSDIQEFLDDLVAAGLAFREEHRYVSLALPARFGRSDDVSHQSVDVEHVRLPVLNA